MSNPDTHNKTAIEYKIGSKANLPVTAKYAPIGANDKPTPKTKWHKAVNLLVKLYPKTTAKAMGDNIKHKGLMNHVVKINNSELIITKTKADVGETIPAGISRTTVRGFFASMSLSKYRLNAIAADLANTIHKRTGKST